MKIKLHILVFLFLLGSVKAQISFLPYKSYPRADGTQNLCIDDINNDGRKDVILATTFSMDTVNDYKLFLYLQNAAHTLDTVPVVYSYPKQYNGAQAMATGDVNNDGLPDIVIGYDDSIGIFHQNPAGGLNPIIRYYSGFDVDGLKIGDLNNDGLSDIAVCHWNSLYMKVFYQNAAGFTVKSFYKAAGGYDEIDIGDVNGDGLKDLVWVSQQNVGLKVYIQSGDSLLPYITYMPPAGFYTTLSGVAIGDLNNDGKNDIAATRGGNSPHAWVDIWYQDSLTGLLDPVVEIPAYDIPVPIEIADLNCDGKNEIVVGNTGWMNVTYYEQQANGSYGPYGMLPLFWNAQMKNCSMACGDISSDGKIDIATSVYDNGMNTLINNSAPPSFASVDTLVYTDTLVIDTLHYSGISYHTSYDTVPPYLIHEVDTLKEIYTYMVDSIKTYTLIIRKGNLCSGPFTDTLVSEVGIKRSYLSSTDTLYLGKHFDSTLVSIIVPNVFSPNGDGVNDYFFIKASGFEFAGYTIFNRWGKVMFETDVWNDGWDGKYNEKDVPEGTYYYIVRGKDVIGGKKEIKGYLLLVR